MSTPRRWGRRPERPARPRSDPGRGRAARRWSCPPRSCGEHPVLLRRPGLGPAASTASSAAPGTTVTPSSSATIQSPTATSTPPTRAESPTPPGCSFVAPGSAIWVENTGKPCAASAATSRTPPSITSPTMPRASAAGGEHLAPVAELGDVADVDDEHRTGGRGRDRDVDREVVARRAAHRVRRRREPGARPRGPRPASASAGRPTRRGSPRRARASVRRRRSGEVGGSGHAAPGVAEGEGFEPSRRLNTPYSLSRRALSATQSSLRDGPSIPGANRDLPARRREPVVGARYLRGMTAQRGARPDRVPARTPARGDVQDPGVPARRRRGPRPLRRRAAGARRRRTAPRPPERRRQHGPGRSPRRSPAAPRRTSSGSRSTKTARSPPADRCGRR